MVWARKGQLPTFVKAFSKAGKVRSWVVAKSIPEPNQGRLSRALLTGIILVDVWPKHVAPSSLW